MVKRKTALFIRKSHRYLGLFLGVQFVMWTLSGLYFSWTDLDEIHGDHFKNPPGAPKVFKNLISPASINSPSDIVSMELREIAGKPYYWVNHEVLVNAENGSIKKGISEEEALQIAKEKLLPHLKVSGIERIDTVGKHHEYRGRLLPAYVISYDTPESIKAYVSIANGAFQTVRHRDWRLFDFLWMTHTMDYEGRDNINTLTLRIFSLMGLITVLSGFILWGISSPSIRKLSKFKRHEKK